MATGAAIIAGLSLAYGVYSGERSNAMQEEANKKQQEAQAAAEAKQAEAETKAEQKRLQALAAEQGGDAGRTSKFDFGIDSATAKAAGTTTPATLTTTTDKEDEDYNPFYARGML